MLISNHIVAKANLIVDIPMASIFLTNIIKLKIKTIIF